MKIKIDYSSKATYDGLKLKWETLQRIKIYAEAQEYQRIITIPIKGLLIKDRGAELIISILEALSSKELFNLEVVQTIFKLNNFKKRKFETYFNKTEVEYKRYAADWENRKRPNLTIREIKSLVKQIIKTNHLSGREARLLEILSNKERHLIKDLEDEIPTKDCPELKNRVSAKIKDERIKITGSRGNSFEKSYYQLLIKQSTKAY